MRQRNARVAPDEIIQNLGSKSRLQALDHHMDGNLYSTDLYWTTGFPESYVMTIET